MYSNRSFCLVNVDHTVYLTAFLKKVQNLVSFGRFNKKVSTHLLIITSVWAKIQPIRKCSLQFLESLHAVSFQRSYPLHSLKPCKNRAKTVQKPCTYSKTNKFRPTPYRLDGIGLSDRTSKSSHGGSHIEQSIFFPLHHRDNRNSPASLLFRIFLLKSGFQILPLSMQCLSMFHLFLAKRLSKRFLKPMTLQRILRFSISQYIFVFLLQRYYYKRLHNTQH